MGDKMEHLKKWLARKALEIITDVDYGMQAGDLVTHQGWKHGPVKVVDINWALSSMAILLNPEKPNSLVVWPVWGAKRI